METQRERLRSNLLRAISHDLRTPLTSIIGASASYMENPEAFSRQECLDMVSTINEDSHWLLNMVENLLTVTRISEGRASVNKSMEPVEEVMSEAVFRLKKRLPDANIRVILPEEFIMIPMDAMLIEQVLINLMENAFYHARSSRPMELYAAVNGTAVTFYVKDYGEGIAPDRLESIFDGEATTGSGEADSYRGMGIGLSICKTIIAAHGGEIRAHNHEEGAEIYFTLTGEQEKR